MFYIDLEILLVGKNKNITLLLEKRRELGEANFLGGSESKKFLHSVAFNTTFCLKLYKTSKGQDV